MYLAFNRGQTYSYGNVDMELYEKFENAESQGKFFREHISKHPDLYPYRKEFSLYPHELEDIREVIDEKLNKDNKQPKP